MRIYFAGVAGTIEREKRWLEAGLTNRLISYYSHVTNNQLNKDTKIIFNQIKKGIDNKNEKTNQTG